jgi:hypothetical protein
MKERLCKKCDNTKPLTDFYKTGRKNGDERAYECKECAKARIKASRDANPDAARDRHLRRTYGITLAPSAPAVEQTGPAVNTTNGV